MSELCSDCGDLLVESGSLNRLTSHGSGIRIAAVRRFAPAIQRLERTVFGREQAHASARRSSAAPLA